MASGSGMYAWGRGAGDIVPPENRNSIRPPPRLPAAASVGAAAKAAHDTSATHALPRRREARQEEGRRDMGRTLYISPHGARWFAHDLVRKVGDFSDQARIDALQNWPPPH